MKNEFSEYFKSIGMKEPVLLRIETIMKYFSQLLPDEEVMDVFVSEYLEADGTRKYERLRLMGKKKGLVAIDFISRDAFSIADQDDPITSVKIEARNYDFEKATTMSRLYIRKFFEYATDSEYNASMENCDQLMRIYEKYIHPNIKKLHAE